MSDNLIKLSTINNAITILGGKIQSDKEREVFWLFRIGDFQLEIEPFQRITDKNITVGIDVSISHDKLSNIVTFILGEKFAARQTISWKQIKKNIALCDGLDIVFGELIERELESTQKISIENLIDEFAHSCPDKPSMKQILHLAALAWKGDYITLAEYRNIFDRGKRLNFVPMITKEMIDRAMEIAIDQFK